jgi:acyl-CoA thioesterase-1
MWASLRAWSLLACLALVACTAKPPALPPLGENDVVLAFGDSLTEGVGAGEAETYPAVLQSLIRRSVINDGVSGEVTEQGLERLPASLDAHQPRLLVLCLGGNDLLRNLDRAIAEANLRRMIQLARARGIAVVLIAVPEPRLLGGVAEFYPRIAKDLQVPIEDQALLDVLKSNGLKSDPIHPNAAGYRRMAEAVATLLREAGAI